MRQPPSVRVGEDRLPQGRDRLGTLAILAATLIAALAITEDVESAVTAVTVLVGLVR